MIDANTSKGLVNYCICQQMTISASAVVANIGHSSGPFVRKCLDYYGGGIRVLRAMTVIAEKYWAEPVFVRRRSGAHRDKLSRSSQILN